MWSSHHSPCLRLNFAYILRKRKTPHRKVNHQVTPTMTGPLSGTPIIAESTALNQPPDRPFMGKNSRTIRTDKITEGSVDVGLNSQERKLRKSSARVETWVLNIMLVLLEFRSYRLDLTSDGARRGKASNGIIDTQHGAFETVAGNGKWRIRQHDDPIGRRKGD